MKRTHFQDGRADMQGIDYPPVIGNTDIRYADLKARLPKHAGRTIFYKNRSGKIRNV